MKSEYEHGERFDYSEDEGRVGHAAVGFDFDAVMRDLDGDNSDSDSDARDAARLAVYKTIEFLICGNNRRKAYNAKTIANRVLTLSILLGIVRPTMQKEIAKQIGLGPASISKEKRRLRGILSSCVGKLQAN